MWVPGTDMPHPFRCMTSDAGRLRPRSVDGEGWSVLLLGQSGVEDHWAPPAFTNGLCDMSCSLGFWLLSHRRAAARSNFWQPLGNRASWVVRRGRFSVDRSPPPKMLWECRMTSSTLRHAKIYITPQLRVSLVFGRHICESRFHHHLLLLLRLATDR